MELYGVVWNMIRKLIIQLSIFRKSASERQTNISKNGMEGKKKKSSFIKIKKK